MPLLLHVNTVLDKKKSCAVVFAEEVEKYK